MNEFIELFNELGSMIEHSGEFGNDHEDRAEQFKLYQKLKLRMLDIINGTDIEIKAEVNRDDSKQVEIYNYKKMIKYVITGDINISLTSLQ